MNRLAFVTNQKLQKAFNVLETLEVGSVWKVLHGNDYTRIKKYIGISSGKYVYDTEVCTKPRWFKKNDWAKHEWRIDEIYLKHDFPNIYKRAVFVELFSMETGFEKKHIVRTTSFIGMSFGIVALSMFFVNHKFPWWNWITLVATIGNARAYFKELKNE